MTNAAGTLVQGRSKQEVDQSIDKRGWNKEERERKKLLKKKSWYMKGSYLAENRGGEEQQVEGG